ncbi:hypothetical protein CR51_25295 [Caballeronia megalochromosomata]|jgi:hypothetical protein|nr:hypothetical protein CR51_25295 [Caballeronia megalochromosomata]
MKATLLMAVSAVSVFMIGAAQAQDTPPAQDSTMQQNAKGDQPAAPDDSGYGGTKPGTMAGNPSSAGANRPCTPGLSCDIYRGQ